MPIAATAYNALSIVGVIDKLGLIHRCDRRNLFSGWAYTRRVYVAENTVALMKKLVYVCVW